MANELTITASALAEKGIDVATRSALKNSIYHGAKDESVMMALDYCRARQLDPLLKPVHLVPMSVKDSRTGKSEWRDVVMPGIGLYRIQADRSGDYAGAREPEFGPDTTQTLSGVEVTFPQWCKYTVYKRMPSGEIVEFSAKEYWIENYATGGRDTTAPNAMWKKRPYGQLAKCAEARRCVRHGLRLDSSLPPKKWKENHWMLISVTSLPAAQQNHFHQQQAKKHSRRSPIS